MVPPCPPQRVPLCRQCGERGDEGVMKPDIVFFGESLPDSFHHQLDKDKTQVSLSSSHPHTLTLSPGRILTSSQADMLIVMGSSLKVRPVSLIPSEP